MAKKQNLEARIQERGIAYARGGSEVSFLDATLVLLDDLLRDSEPTRMEAWDPPFSEAVSRASASVLGYKIAAAESSNHSNCLSEVEVSSLSESTEIIEHRPVNRKRDFELKLDSSENLNPHDRAVSGILKENSRKSLQSLREHALPDVNDAQSREGTPSVSPRATDNCDAEKVSNLTCLLQAWSTNARSCMPSKKITRPTMR